MHVKREADILWSIEAHPRAPELAKVDLEAQSLRSLQPLLRGNSWPTLTHRTTPDFKADHQAIPRDLRGEQSSPEKWRASRIANLWR